MEKNEAVLAKMQELFDKYNLIGQSTESYLEGLLYTNPLGYWDYIQTDTLLSIQHPKTDFPDELIFIMYHQITELYFKLTLHEMEQIANNGKEISAAGQNLGWKAAISAEFMTARLKRINAYFEALTKSFDVMVHGMEKEQFLKFRMALLPASGFQSAQYRMIEIAATDLIHIVHKDHRAKLKDANIAQQFEEIYWKTGATELETGKKTLTLKEFEKKYSNQLIAWANQFSTCNLWQKFRELQAKNETTPALIEEMKKVDLNVNVFWPLVHYKSAVRYLANDESDTPATGGTNWQQYLPPRFQKRIFYPELWSEEEQNEWGKSWVMSTLNAKK